MLTLRRLLPCPFVLACLISLPCLTLFTPQATAESSPPLLHQLSAGTSLVVRKPLLIRANDLSVVLTPIARGAQISCTLWMHESMPFDRVLKPGRQMAVLQTHRNGFTARGTLSTIASVSVDSSAVQDITCSNRIVGREPTIHEFEQAIREHFELMPAPGPIEI